MRPSKGVAMDGAEINEYLDTHWRGVLCFGDGDAGHGTPVSFAYDPDARDLYFRVAEKPAAWSGGSPESGGHASIVSYEESDGRHRAVVAEGRLDSVADPGLDSTVKQSADELKIPSVPAFDPPGEEAALHLVRLQIETVSGRKEKLVSV